MKVSEIVKQTKEYERLTGIIKSIESAIKDFDRMHTVENNIYYDSGGVNLCGRIFNTITTSDVPAKRQIDVYLNKEVSELVRDDVKAVLKKHLIELKNQRNRLEI